MYLILSALHFPSVNSAQRPPYHSQLHVLTLSFLEFIYFLNPLIPIRTSSLSIAFGSSAGSLAWQNYQWRFQITLKIDFIILKCVCVFICVWVCTCECSIFRDQKREAEALKLDLQVTGRGHAWMLLGVKLNSFAEMANVLNYWAICLASLSHFHWPDFHSFGNH